MLLYQNSNSSRMNHFVYLIFENELYPSHFHGSFELLWAMKGSSRFTVDRNALILEEGQMCLILPNQIHSFTVEVKNRLWVCVFSPDLVDHFRQETENKAYPHPIFTPSKTLLDMLPKENDLCFQDPFLLRACLHLVCHEFYQQASPISAARNADPHTAHQILSYISGHYSQNLTLEHLAKEFGLNKQYLSSLIGGMTHQNFRTYLNGYRLEKSKQLLKTTADPITAIAFECGFNNLRTFNRVFLKSEGVSPSAYRNHWTANR